MTSYLIALAVGVAVTAPAVIPALILSLFPCKDVEDES
jgi:hypothetical protein